MKRFATASLLVAGLATCLAGQALAQGRGLGGPPGGVGVGPPVGMGIPAAIGGIPPGVAGGLGGPAAGVGAPVGGIGPPPSVTLPDVSGHAGAAAGAAVVPPGQLIRNLVQSGHDLVGRPTEARAVALAAAQDPAGYPVIRDQILATSPSETSLAIAQRLHFHLEKVERLESLGLSVAVLTVPSGMSAADGLASLRQADPSGTYDYDHLYNPTGSSRPAAIPVMPASAQPTSTEPHDYAIRIGIIDGGIDREHPALKPASIRTQCFVPGCTAQPTQHGTAIASLMVGHNKEFSGYLPEAKLYAADIFGGAVDGGSAEEIAQALNWLAANKIPVTNVSLAGPPNALLAAAVKAFLGGGHMLVAAVGNGGPAAPLSYPAAYPGVIAVTSVDSNRHVEIDASPGAQFAAFGINVNVAKMGGGYEHVTGTSYAAPAVSANLAQFLSAPNSQKSAAAFDQLVSLAVPFDASGQTLRFVAAPSNSNRMATSIAPK